MDRSGSFMVFIAIYITFFTRTNPSILQPPLDGAGLLIATDDTLEESACLSGFNWKTKASIVCKGLGNAHIKF